MPKQNQELIRFNAGRISPLAIARNDLKRAPFSSQVQTNWMPRSLGSMMLRPGLGYIGSTYSNHKAKHLPFVFSVTDTAAVELTDQFMRVRVADQIISRPSVSSALVNGNFDTTLNSWTSIDQAGTSSAWAAAALDYNAVSYTGLMTLRGTNFNSAGRYQLLNVAGGDIGKEHGLRLRILRGYVKLRVGYSVGDDALISETILAPGIHSLAFTPQNNNVYIQVQSSTQYLSIIDGITIEDQGDMVLPTPWPEVKLSMVRFDQSGDVQFIACQGYRQKKIERRATRSWSLVDYLADDGPFRVQNLTTTSITPSGLVGNVTLNASDPLFKASHRGTLYRLTSIGQVITASLTGDGQFTDEIRITGVGAAQRSFTIARSNTWSGTLTLQRSVGEPGAWIDVGTYTTNGSTSYNDGLDNQIIYYRVGFKTAGYTSGQADVTMSYANGGLDGIVRITDYVSPTQVYGDVLQALGNTTATTTWSEGEWSDYRGWPTAVCFYEGRLWWAGKDKIQASASDAFSSFDDTIEGDSAPISRSIGSGPVDTINWLIPLQRLGIGGQGAEHFALSSSLDEPLTPSAFNIKTPSTQGSAPVPAVKIDNDAAYVQRSRTRVMQIGYDSNTGQYSSEEATAFVPEIGEAGISWLAVQRQPDTRLHAMRDDGTVGLQVYSKFQDVNCWVDMETPGAGGIVEDIYTLPGTTEDVVYYCVNRTVNGVTVRYLEKWAKESECQGGTLNKQMDSFITYSGTPTNILSVPHLPGCEVVVWADGKDLSPMDASGNSRLYTVSTMGMLTLDAGVTVSNAVIGLYYDAPYLSGKQSFAAALGTPLNQVKRIDSMGMILRNTHAQGVLYGPSLDELDQMPLEEDGEIIDPDKIWGEYDHEMVEFDGDFTTDARIALRAQAPRPATVVALTVGMETHG